MGKLATKLLGGIATLYCHTWRLKFHGKHNLEKYTVSNRRVLAAIWHDQLLPLTWCWKNRNASTVASQSKDGEIIVSILQSWGYEVARGSSTRGGTRALVGLRKFLDRGMTVALTVDGPKGPRHIVKEGLVYLAKATNTPVVPIFARCGFYKRFASWDKFILPLPFARVDIYMTEEVYFSQDMSKEAVEEDRLKLEKIMLERTYEVAPDFI